jgi:DNA-binding HxlR family transcriptional regulator
LEDSSDEEVNLMSEDNLSVEIKVTKSCELFVALRKFANPNNALVAEVLCKSGALEFGEIRVKTKLHTQTLNHCLSDLRNVEVVKKVGTRYCITVFGALLVDSIEDIKNEIFKVRENAFDAKVK